MEPIWDPWADPVPFLQQKDIDNSVIERILRNEFQSLPITYQPVKIPWDEWLANGFGRETGMGISTKHGNIFQDNKKYRYVPGLIVPAPHHPQLSSLTLQQHQQYLRVLNHKGSHLYALNTPLLKDYIKFKETIEIYQNEQKEYIKWAKRQWVNGDCIRALRPAPLLELEYMAEFAMRACAVASLEQNYWLAAQIRMRTIGHQCEMELKEELIKVDVMGLPDVEYPEVLHSPLSILKERPRPAPCELHPCKFVLPGEGSVSMLPLIDIHKQLAHYCADNEAQVVASENALRCLVETHRSWKLPVSVIQVECPDGETRNMVVVGSEFSVRMEYAPERAYRAYSHLLGHAFTPNFGQYKINNPTKPMKNKSKGFKNPCPEDTTMPNKPVPESTKKPNSNGRNNTTTVVETKILNEVATIEINNSKEVIPKENASTSFMSLDDDLSVTSEDDDDDRLLIDDTAAAAGDTSDNSVSKPEPTYSSTQSPGKTKISTDKGLQSPKIRSINSAILSPPKSCLKILSPGSAGRHVRKLSFTDSNKPSRKKNHIEVNSGQRARKLGFSVPLVTETIRDFGDNDPSSLASCKNSVSATDRQSVKLGTVFEFGKNNLSLGSSEHVNDVVDSYNETATKTIGNDTTSDQLVTNSVLESNITFTSEPTYGETSPLKHNIPYFFGLEKSNTGENTDSNSGTASSPEMPLTGFCEDANNESSAENSKVRLEMFNLNYKHLLVNQYGNKPIVAKNVTNPGNLNVNTGTIEQSNAIYKDCATNEIPPVTITDGIFSQPTSRKHYLSESDAGYTIPGCPCVKIEPLSKDILDKYIKGVKRRYRRHLKSPVPYNLRSRSKLTDNEPVMKSELEVGKRESIKADRKAFLSNSQFNRELRTRRHSAPTKNDINKKPVKKFSLDKIALVETKVKVKGNKITLPKTNETCTIKEKEHHSEMNRPQTKMYTERYKSSLCSQDTDHLVYQFDLPEYRLNSDKEKSRIKELPNATDILDGNVMNNDKDESFILTESDKEDTIYEIEIGDSDHETAEEISENTVGLLENNVTNEPEINAQKNAIKIDNTHLQLTKSEVQTRNLQTRLHALFSDTDSSDDEPLLYVSNKKTKANSFERKVWAENLNTNNDSETSTKIDVLPLTGDTKIADQSTADSNKLNQSAANTNNTDQSTENIKSDQWKEGRAEDTVSNNCVSTKLNKTQTSLEPVELDSLYYGSGEDMLDVSNLSKEAINEIIGVTHCTCKDTIYAVPPPRSFKKWQLRNKTTFESLDVIVHTPHKARKGGKEVILEPIVEYQPDKGGARQPAKRVRSLALALMLRGAAHLLNVRVEHAKGEVIQVEAATGEEWMARHDTAGDLAGDVADALHTTLAQLRHLMPGQYVLDHNSRHGPNAVLYTSKKVSTPAGETLSLKSDSIHLLDSEETSHVKIPPELEPVLLPYHKYRKILPCAFTPHHIQVKEDKKLAQKPKHPPQAIQDGVTAPGTAQWLKKKKKKRKKRNVLQEGERRMT